MNGNASKLLTVTRSRGVGAVFGCMVNVVGFVCDGEGMAQDFFCSRILQLLHIRRRLVML